MRQAAEALLLIAIGVWSIVDGFRVTAVARREGVFDALGPDRYIMVLGALLIIGAVAYVLGSRREGVLSTGDTVEPDQPSSPRKFVLLVLAFVGYALIAPVLGYPLVTAAFFIASYWIMELRGLLALVLSAALSAAVFVLLFVVIADMPLPRGMFGP